MSQQNQPIYGAALPADQQQSEELVEVLQQVQGDPELVIQELYRELRRYAAAIRNRDERPEHSLQPTAIVNEVYLRVTKTYGDRFWLQERKKILSIFCSAVRNFLREYHRNKVRQRRPTSGIRVKADALDTLPVVQLDPDLLDAVNQALDHLKQLHPRQYQVVELRISLRLDLKEIAELLDVHVNTVKLDWQAASMFLKRACDLSRPQDGATQMDQVDWRALDRFLDRGIE
ncbi:MAG: hypothetical protein K1X67_15185 [Fimbriimonadaceae bacterium]|nr:hypothetical protein [Fimbriimonadaceae bacterium]